MGRLLICLALADYAAADGNNRGCKIGSADHAVAAAIPGRAFSKIRRHHPRMRVIQ
jgi:hypothetical protein